MKITEKSYIYFLTNNISHDHIFYSMCNLNMLIIVTTSIIVHDVLVFYGLRAGRLSLCIAVSGSILTQSLYKVWPTSFEGIQLITAY